MIRAENPQRSRAVQRSGRRDTMTDWEVLRAAAGPRVFRYALTHEDGWSLEHLRMACSQQLSEAYTRLHAEMAERLRQRGEGGFSVMTCNDCAQTTSGACWRHPKVVHLPNIQTIGPAPYATASGRIIGTPICPDLLDLEALGVADNNRGRVVRAFFRIMDWLWPVSKTGSDS